MNDTLQFLILRYVQPYTKGRAIPPCVSVAPLNVYQAVEVYWTNAVLGAYNPPARPEESLPLPLNTASTLLLSFQSNPT